MTSDSNEESIRISRIDRELRHLLSIAQSQMRPGFSRVRRFVNAITDRKIRPMQPFAAADVNNLRIGNRDCDGAD